MAVMSAQASEHAVNTQTVRDASAMVSKLPDPAQLQHLEDFFARANGEEKSQVLMHIAISGAYSARDVVVNQLRDNNPLVVDRALRAMTALGFANEDQRELIEVLLTHDSKMVAMQAAACLGSSDDLRAIPALIATLKQKNQEIVGAALLSLQRLSGVDFKTDADAWSAWYQINRQQTNDRMRQFAVQLSSGKQDEQMTAIQALASSRTDRLEAISLLEPMLDNPDEKIALVTRQALATLAPTQYSMPSQQEIAAVVQPQKIVETQAGSGVIDYLAQRGFFDTWWGLAMTVITVIGILAIVLYLLRSPQIKNATRRFSRVVVTSTEKIIKPITARIRRGTQRIANGMRKKPLDINQKRVS
jgi:HEAT repeat protein